MTYSCFRLQRYKFLKAIHNHAGYGTQVRKLFQTTKIQIFESNSQRSLIMIEIGDCCFRLQRYKFLKAIHNLLLHRHDQLKVVSDYKDTNF